MPLQLSALQWGVRLRKRIYESQLCYSAELTPIIGALVTSLLWNQRMLPSIWQSRPHKELALRPCDLARISVGIMCYRQELALSLQLSAKKEWFWTVGSSVFLSFELTATKLGTT